MTIYIMIVCGGCYTVIWNKKNEIYVCGAGYHGQLGLGDSKDRNKFEKVKYDLGEIKNIACNRYHTVIQNKKDEIYVCGNNEYGELGLGDDKHRYKFEKVEKNFGKIKNIVCGDSHTMVQNEKNEIYACGCNVFGQLGSGNKNSRDKFEKVEYDFGEIKNIACGEKCVIVQNEKNEVYVCGGNESGQLGLGDCEDRDKFEKVVQNFGKIKNIACGLYHTVIQNEKNEIYVCGENHHGQLGVGDNDNRYRYEKVNYDFGEIKNISCGGYHTIIQNENNEIYVCGGNWAGQLGLGNKKKINRFEKVEFDFGTIKNIACGEYHVMIQNEKNDVYVCGNNEHGQLGFSDKENRDRFETIDIENIFEKIYNLELKLNTEEIEL